MPPVLPFRPFFILAVIDSIAAVAVWTLPPSAAALGLASAPLAGWHGRELLFGVFPAVISGFLLTALPRWTGTRPHPRLHIWLAWLWLCGPAVLILAPAWRPVAAAAYLTILTVVIGHRIGASGDRRNDGIALLLALLTGAGFIDLMVPAAADRALRLAIAAILGLVMVLGGRIVPSLTAVHCALRGGPELPPRSAGIEVMAAVAATAALAAWLWSPPAAASAGLAAAAAVGQSLRWLRWQPWRARRTPALLALHAGYACLPAGFALVFLHGMAPAAVPAAVALHVWTIGAIGLTCVAVMASMIRRHLGRPLTESSRLNVAFVLLAAALAARAGADFLAPSREPLIAAAAAAWIVAHLLFLAWFAGSLRAARDAAPGTGRPG